MTLEFGATNFTEWYQGFYIGTHYMCRLIYKFNQTVRNKKT